jgi:hypothetical protein
LVGGTLGGEGVKLVAGRAMIDPVSARTLAHVAQGRIADHVRCNLHAAVRESLKRPLLLAVGRAEPGKVGIADLRGKVRYGFHDR